MTVSVQWDQDPAKPGLPDSGSDSKTYVAGQEGQHTVTVTSETDPTKTQTVTFTIPLTGTGAAITADKTEVPNTGDAAARTVNVTGTGWSANATVTLSVNTGAPGSGGTAVVTGTATADAAGAFPATALVVPEATAEGPHHIIATSGTTTVDNTALTVTGGAGTAVITPDKTTVDASGDEAARTISTTGTGFPASTAGRLALMTGAPGSGGNEVVGADITTDAAGAFAATPLIVPANQAAGDYHLMATVGATIVDNTAITVTAAPVEPAITVTPATVPSAGTDQERTVVVNGTGFPANTTGNVAMFPGAPGSGGEEIIALQATSDATGAFPDTTFIVPSGQAPGDYHWTATFGAVVSDNTAFTVTGTPGGGSITVDPTEVVSSNPDAAARTFTVTGTGFPASTAGTIEVMTGAAGTDGTVVVSVPVTTDAAGAFAATGAEVPQDTASGPHHVKVTVGAVISDNTDVQVLIGQLAVPTGAAVSNPTATDLTVTWTAVENADSYRVQYKVSTDTEYTLVPDPVTTTTHTLTGLTDATTYDIQVAAVDSTGAWAQSDWSPAVQGTTTA